PTEFENDHAAKTSAPDRSLTGAGVPSPSSYGRRTLVASAARRLHSTHRRHLTALDAPHLVVQACNAAADDRREGENRAYCKCGNARQALSDRTAEGGDAAEAHQDRADDMIGDVLDRR